MIAPEIIPPEIQKQFVRYLLKNSRVTDVTVKQYFTHIEKYARFAASRGYPDLFKITTFPVANDLLLDLQEAGRSKDGEPLSDSYTFKIGAMISTYWKFAARYEYMPKNPFADGIGIKKPQAREYEAIERDSQLARNILEAVPSLRDKAVIHLLFASGVRRLECAQQKIEDVCKCLVPAEVNEPQRWIYYVIVRKGKGGKERTSPICVITYEVIQDWIQYLRFTGYRGEYLFPSRDFTTHCDADTIYKVCIRIKKRLGLERLTPHMLRHSLAAYAIEKGADISEVADWLGHDDLQTTKRYTHHRPKHLAGKYQRLGCGVPA